MSTEIERLKNDVDFYKRRLFHVTQKNNGPYLAIYARNRDLHKCLERAVLILKRLGYNVSEMERVCDVERSEIRKALARSKTGGA